MTPREAGEIAMAGDLARAAVGYSEAFGIEPTALLVTALVIAARLAPKPGRCLEQAVRSINEARADLIVARRCAHRRTA